MAGTSRIMVVALIGCAFISTGCLDIRPHSGGEPCGVVGPVRTVDAQVTEVDQGAWSSPYTMGIPVERSPLQATVVTLKYRIRRVSGECIIQYLGPLTLAISYLPQGITATFEPATLAEAGSGDQSFRLILQIPPEIQDGLLPLYINDTQGVLIRPYFTLSLKTLKL